MHGRSLATAVEAALEVNQQTLRHQRPVRGKLSSVLETFDLEFATPDRPDFAYPAQVIRFGNDLMLVALGNEVVVDYALRLKRELTKPDGPAVWIAGYSNVYSGYIPASESCWRVATKHAAGLGNRRSKNVSSARCTSW